MSAWWLMWMLFMVFIVASPVGYGWGYRGWGPPYPSYLQRRRSQQLAGRGVSGPFRHESWGFGGDILWFVFFVGLLWVVAALFWSPLK